MVDVCPSCMFVRPRHRPRSWICRVNLWGSLRPKEFAGLAAIAGAFLGFLMAAALL